MNNIAALITLIFLWLSPFGKSKVYEWRGKDRSGIYNDSNLLKAWPSEGPKELWTIETDSGLRYLLMKIFI
jgi:outer membrane protein assembly factor BamB